MFKIILVSYTLQGFTSTASYQPSSRRVACSLFLASLSDVYSTTVMWPLRRNTFSMPTCSSSTSCHRSSSTPDISCRSDHSLITLALFYSWQWWTRQLTQVVSVFRCMPYLTSDGLAAPSVYCTVWYSGKDAQYIACISLISTGKSVYSNNICIVGCHCCLQKINNNQTFISGLLCEAASYL